MQNLALRLEEVDGQLGAHIAPVCLYGRSRAPNFHDVLPRSVEGSAVVYLHGMMASPPFTALAGRESHACKRLERRRRLGIIIIKYISQHKVCFAALL